MKKIMLIYPPGKLYQRGEDRSQGNVDDSTATSMRACNDMGYAAATLKQRGYNVFLRDYQTENKSLVDLKNKFCTYLPEVLIISITNATIFQDLEIANQLAQIKADLIIVLKGALFFKPDEDLLAQLDLTKVNYLVGGESDFIIADLLDCHFNNQSKLYDINGILYKDDSGTWLRTSFDSFVDDLDSIPFPDRNAMNNSLYVRPDTGATQATIVTSRGCASNCVYCLTPQISGQKVRLRSPDNILEEMLECYNKHQIKNFFFKSDTFTINPDWVHEICSSIINSNMNGKIQWVANSRVRPLAKETLLSMKKAGCWLVAFGFESGSSETMKKIKKGATVEDNIKAAHYAKEAGLKTFGFYMIGFPWESHSHLIETKKLIYKINADFMELHLAIPYYGTPLYKIFKNEGLITESVLGKDYFNPPMTGTRHIEFEELVTFRKKLLLSYHLRPSFITKKLIHALANPVVVKNYFKFGMRLLRQNIKS